jgi:hypothetical protein
MQKSQKASARGIRAPFMLLTVAVALGVIAMWRIGATQAQITGTISQTEPPVRPDGTAAHPYAEATECPAHTDLVFWPSGRSVPSFPTSLSVCFVGNEPFENSGPDRVEVRDR